MRTILHRVGLTLAVMLISAAALAAPRLYSLTVEGMACPLCAFRVKQSLSALDGVEDVQVHLRSGQAVVTMTEGAVLDEAEARAAITALGYALRDFEEVQSAAER